MMYWLLPRLFQTQLYSKKLAEPHFWVATFGILLYVVAIYSAGVTQGLMWRAFDETGRLAYPDFVETVMKLMPMYWMRAAGGTLYIVGHAALRLQHPHDVAPPPGDVRGAGDPGAAPDEEYVEAGACRTSRPRARGRAGRASSRMRLAPRVGAPAASRSRS